LDADPVLQRDAIAAAVDADHFLVLEDRDVFGRVPLRSVDLQVFAGQGRLEDLRQSDAGVVLIGLPRVDLDLHFPGIRFEPSCR
jgi:hypothetical protein